LAPSTRYTRSGQVVFPIAGPERTKRIEWVIDPKRSRGMGHFHLSASGGELLDKINEKKKIKIFIFLGY